MQVIKMIPKKWGNSFGVTIPSEVVKAEHITDKKEISFIILTSNMENIRKTIGTLKRKRPIEKIMKELDMEND